MRDIVSKGGRWELAPEGYSQQRGGVEVSTSGI